MFLLKNKLYTKEIHAIKICNKYNYERYFINSGRVVLFEEKSKKILKVLKKGDTFGEHQFFSG